MMETILLVVAGLFVYELLWSMERRARAWFIVVLIVLALIEFL